MFKTTSQMKSKLTIFIAFLTLSFSNVFAQNQEDLQSLSIFSEYVKSKNYDSAIYVPFGVTDGKISARSSQSLSMSLI